MDTLRRFFRELRHVLEIMKITALHLVVAVLATAVLAFTPQIYEALRVVAEDRMGPAVRELGLIEVGAVLLATMLWYSARVLLYLLAPTTERDERRTRRLAARYLPRLYGLFPLLALSWSFLRASRIPEDAASTAPTFLFVATAITAAVAVAWLLALVLRRSIMNARPLAPPADEAQKPATESTRPRIRDLDTSTLRAFGGMIVLWLILFISVWATGGLVAIRIGTVPTVLVGLATWVPIGTLLAYSGARFELPVLRTVFAIAILMAATDCNDNHYVRTVDGPVPPARTFEAHLTQWYASRQDKVQFPAKYPVFIVAAEGGGIRNSYLTATVLAALHDACPLFTHHLLAISSVSGGSVGAAIFTGLLADAPTPSSDRCVMPHPDNPGAMQAHVDSILSRDLLAPPIAAGLYLEAFQKVWPHGIVDFDRARGLERAVERAYSLDPEIGKKSSNAMTSPFLSLVSTSLPLLFFNTTSVEEGERMVVATADPSTTQFHPRTLHEVNPALNVSLSTAAVMSSRFPFVSPEAVVRTKSGSTMRYVDGGYFDNSGVTTAIDLASATLSVDSAFFGALGMHLMPVIVHIGLADVTRAEETRASGTHSLGLHEILAPVRTMLSTRSSRGSVVTRQLFEQSTLWHGDKADVVDLDAAEGDIPFVLGWLMSENARTAMKGKVSPRVSCPSAKEGEHPIACGYDRVRALLGQQ